MSARQQSGESERPPASAPEPAEPHFVVTEHPFNFKKLALRAGAILATGATFVAATAGGLVLHMGVPPARRLAATAVNEILTGTFRGKIDVVRVARLLPNGVDGTVVTLTDPDGNRVALLEGIHARIALFPLLTSILSGGDMRVRVSELSIDHVDGLLRQAADGSLSLLQSFQPAKEEPPPPPKKKASGLDLSLPKIALKHAWVHGGTSALPLIDADIDAIAASFGMTPDTTSVDVRKLRLNTRGMPKNADVLANIEAHLVLPVDATKMSGSVVFVGTVGGIDTNVHGGIDGKQVDAVVDVPSVVPAQLDRMLGESPIHQPASAHIEAHGALPHIDPSVHVAIGEGTVDLHGSVTIPTEGQSDTFAKVTLAARNLDARAASLTAPRSKLGLDASAQGRLSAAGAADGTYDLHILPGVVGSEPTPSAQIAGTFAPTSVRGEARIAEPGVPSEIRFNVNPVAADGPDVAFDASVQARNLAEVPQLGGMMLGGRATVHAAGNVALGTKRVSARVETTVDAFHEGSIAVHHAEITASVKGTFARPSAVVSVDGRGLEAAGYSYPFFNAIVDGTPQEVHVDANLRGGSDPAVRAAATIAVANGVAARDVTVSLTRDKDSVTTRVARATSNGGKVDVEGIRVEGVGDPLEGELHLRPGSVAARATASRIDVPTLLRIAGVKSDLKEGALALDVDVTATKRATKGHVNAALSHVTYGTEVKELSAKIASSFDGEKADLHVNAVDAAKESVTIDAADAHLGAGALDPKAWKGATGRLQTVANVDLHRVKQGTGNALPFDELGGRLTARVDLTRDDATKRPSVVLDAATHDLVLTTQPKSVPSGDRTVVLEGRAFHTEGMDAHVKASFDGENGETSFDALVRDQVGRLLEANASVKLPVDALIDDDGDSRDALLSTPMRVHMEVPVRSIAAIPQLLGTVPARGDFGFIFDAEGTAKAPHVQAIVHARNITDADDPTPTPISFDTAAIYDGDQLRAKIIAFNKTAQVMDVNANVALKVADVLAGKMAWEANGDVTLTKFPIGAVTGFADENAIDGELSGKVALHDLHKAGSLDANLDLAKVEINGGKFGDTTVSASVRDGSLKVHTRLSQLDGFADVAVAGGINWGDAVAPSVDETKPIDLALQAKNFRLAMFAPFVRTSVSELDGRLSATTKLHVKPGMKDGTMDGAILVDKGLFETTAIGEEFHNMKARIFMKPWGVWNVAEISADGTSGHFTASASAHVKGIHFESGEAHLKIAEKEKLPLEMQGTSFGTIWGQVDTTAGLTPDGKTVNIAVKVPSLHIALPDSIGHSVQSTTPDQTIKVGSIEAGGIVALLPVDGSLPLPAPEQPKKKNAEPGLKLHVTTSLGPNFEVRRNTMLRAYVTDGPTIDIGDETKISGKIAIPRGYIELQGKRFQIEKGTVNFTGQEVDDPVVVATAAYDSPDGTKVFADFVGPVKTGKLTLRSEPELGQNEILALLLFGSSDGTFGQSTPQGQQGNDGTEAASLAGGVVTEGLNKAISGVTGVEIQTKVDTGESGDPRPEVEVALSRDVSATVIYNLGVPPPGQNPDDTLLVADWRFYRNYSADATLGDKGTSILDLTWKYRY